MKCTFQINGNMNMSSESCMNQIKNVWISIQYTKHYNLFLSSLVESLAFSEMIDVSPEGGGGD